MRNKSTCFKICFVIIVVLLNVFSKTDSYAGSPVLNGVFDTEEGWGTPIASDPSVGWAGAFAQNLYVTSDENYIYFGAKVTASDWQGW
ncbi:MAG: hypothetical protein GX587_14430, partial [Bacteroidales bacterium]|nr:hypothetical protein [Bacteroidales bacterium]